jgi:hypothetical protein
MLRMQAKGVRNGKEVSLVILGLSHKNLEELKKGHPIAIHDAVRDIPGVEIFIFSGKTEQAMAREVQELIGPNTKVNIDPRLRD